jgi:hypothetical protein
MYYFLGYSEKICKICGLNQWNCDLQYLRERKHLMKELLFSNEILDGHLDDGIMVLKFKVKKFDLDAAKVAVAARIEASKGIAFPMLVDGREVSSISKEARDYFATDDGIKFLLASALVADSVLGKFLGNFFLQINKPKVPLRLFTDDKEAYKWLQQFKPKKSAK